MAMISTPTASVTVTFDTNSIDKAARPDRHPKDLALSDFQKVHEALKGGALRGFLCETMVTLEGIQRVDRAQVFGTTYLAASLSELEQSPDGTIGHQLTLTTTQPGRRPLHLENERRAAAALGLGFRVLSAPRIAMPKIDDPEQRFYVHEENGSEAQKSRLDRFLMLRVPSKIESLGACQL